MIVFLKFKIPQRHSTASFPVLIEVNVVIVLLNDCILLLDMITWNLQIQMATRNDLIKKLTQKSGQR